MYKQDVVRVGDLWLDAQDDVCIVTAIDEPDYEGTICIEVISGDHPGRKFHERYDSFGVGDNGEQMFFHTLLSRSLND